MRGMTQNETPESTSLADVHHIEIPCGVIDLGPKSADWSKVTCGGCRLEQPMQDVPGRREYRTPQNVIEIDRLLGEQDRKRALETSLAAVEAVYAMQSESIEHLKAQRAETRAKREELVRALRELQTAQNGSMVVREGSGVSGPQKGSQGVRYRILAGHAAGGFATFLRRVDRPRFGSAICVRVDGESVERCYSERFLQKIEVPQGAAELIEEYGPAPIYRVKSSGTIGILRGVSDRGDLTLYLGNGGVGVYSAIAVEQIS
jgi:hypothetical protein